MRGQQGEDNPHCSMMLLQVQQRTTFRSLMKVKKKKKTKFTIFQQTISFLLNLGILYGQIQGLKHLQGVNYQTT